MAIAATVALMTVTVAGQPANAKSDDLVVADDELVLPEGVTIEDGNIKTEVNKPLTKEQIEFMNRHTSGCFAYAQAWNPVMGNVEGRAHSVGWGCSGLTVCARMFSSLTGYQVDGEWCSAVVATRARR